MKKDVLINFSLLVLRLVTGVIFFAHGAQKVLALFGGSGIDGFAENLTKMGFPLPYPMAWTAGLVELIGGAFLVLGVCVRSSSFLLAIVMAVAVVKVHGSAELFLKNGGYEYALTLFAVCISLLLSGSGKFSLWSRL